jgi:hypothetical protein
MLLKHSETMLAKPIYGVAALTGKLGRVVEFQNRTTACAGTGFNDRHRPPLAASQSAKRQIAYPLSLAVLPAASSGITTPIIPPSEI